MGAITENFKLYTVAWIAFLTLPLAAIVAAIVYAAADDDEAWKIALGGYVGVMNLWGFIAVALDKCYAKQDYRRIKEVSLLSIHFATGTWCGYCVPRLEFL